MSDDPLRRLGMIKAAYRWQALEVDTARTWARYPRWEALEFLLLSVGVVPGSVSVEHILKERDRFPFGAALTDIANVFDRDDRKDHVITAQRPSQYLEWCDRFGFVVPEMLRTAVERTVEPYDRAGANAAQRHEPADIATRERESLLKLVIGMAVKGYRYDPKASRSDKVKEIADDLATLGIPLDPDTVRKYLREGRELLPPETE